MQPDNLRVSAILLRLHVRENAVQPIDLLLRPQVRAETGDEFPVRSSSGTGGGSGGDGAPPSTAMRRGRW